MYGYNLLLFYCYMFKHGSKHCPKPSYEKRHPSITNKSARFEKDVDFNTLGLKGNLLGILL